MPKAPPPPANPTPKHLVSRRRPKLRLLVPDRGIPHPVGMEANGTVILGEIITFAEWEAIPPASRPAGPLPVIPGIGFFRASFFPGGVREGTPDHDRYLDAQAAATADLELRFGSPG